MNLINILFGGFGRIFLMSKRIKRRLLMLLLRPLFGNYGMNFWFDPEGSYSFENIHIGNNVFLGTKPILSASRSQIVIGNNVMFGPEVNILGGNHTTIYKGRFMVDVHDTDKRPEDDLGVIIEDDVWVGTRALILHGVTIGRGSIVGAGSVVTKSVPPYAIVAGNPAHVKRFRWSIEDILIHESKLYPLEKQLTRVDLESLQALGSMLSIRKKL